MKKVLGVIIFIAGLVFSIVEGARIQKMGVENKTSIENKLLLKTQKISHEKTLKMPQANNQMKKSSFESSM